jgi:two-component system chemotaxis response regulator CheY
MFNLPDKSILIVDDSLIMRLVLVMNLKRLLGATVVEAVNGQDALNKLENGRFDLVLTDMVMPEMDGAELIRQIRSRLKSDIPIIIITTKGEKKDRELGLSLGANGYLTKPVNMVELVRTVLAFLDDKKNILKRKEQV